MNACRCVLFVAALLAGSSAAMAQTRNAEVALGVGLGRVWDDEGLLGSGMAVQGSGGFHFGKASLHASVDRLPYFRDIEYLRFDGALTYVGAELMYRFGGGRARPFAAAGIGGGRDSHIWVHKNRDINGRVTEETTTHESTFGATTAGVGLEIAVTDRVAIRPAVKIYLMRPPDDLDPHMAWRAGVGAAWRW